jgi:hypothetical protein
MPLSERNIIEKIDLAYKNNDHKAIAKACKYVSKELAKTVRLQNWDTLNAETRAQVLKKAILYKDEESSGSSSDCLEAKGNYLSFL